MPSRSMSHHVILASSLTLLLLGAACSAPAAGSCSSTADCASVSGKPYCSGHVGVCVQCNEDVQCPQGQYCNPDGTCAPGCPTPHGRCALNLYCKPGADCVQCLNDAQCPAGEVCKNDSCVPGCNASHECGDAGVCDTGSSTCVGCRDSKDCHGATPACEPSTHTCVACTANSDCTDPGKPTCDTATHTCVGCLPAHDTCPAGEYCRADGVCERGCKATADCGASSCQPNHSCGTCTDDKQCAAGQVCSSGTCVEACSATNPCGSGRDCCGGHCVDTTSDDANCGRCGTSCGGAGACCNGACKAYDTSADCGACGRACGAGAACCNQACVATTDKANCGGCGITCTADQFCDGTKCQAITFPNFCANLKVYAIHDDAKLADGGLTLDNGATDVLASTIARYCSSQTVIQVGSQNNPAWVDPDGGTLLVPGASTVVTAGGPFPNKVSKWLERTKKVTKVYFSTNSPAADTFYFKRRSDDATLVTRAQTWCSNHQDVFVVELAADPTSSALALLSYGLCSPGVGTATGAWYWANVMLPNKSTYTDSWYLYEWVDANLNGVADQGDTFTQLSSGK